MMEMNKSQRRKKERELIKVSEQSVCFSLSLSLSLYMTQHTTHTIFGGEIHAWNGSKDKRERERDEHVYSTEDPTSFLIQRCRFGQGERPNGGDLERENERSYLN